MTGIRKGFVGRILDLEPLLTRGAIISIFAVVGMVLNHSFADGTVEYTINVVLAAFGFLTAVSARSAVTPNKKVVTYLPNPIEYPNKIESGGTKDYTQDF